jgi:hypothetical protein
MDACLQNLPEMSSNYLKGGAIYAYSADIKVYTTNFENNAVRTVSGDLLNCSECFLYVLTGDIQLCF